MVYVGGGGGEIIGKTKSGEIFDCEIAIQKMVNSNERPFLFTVVFRDITERKKAENELKKLNDKLEKRFTERTHELKSSRAFLEAILNSTIDAILTIDCHGTIQSINKSAITIFGLEEAELLGKNLSELLQESYRSEYMQDISLRKARKRKSQRDE